MIPGVPLDRNELENALSRAGDQFAPDTALTLTAQGYVLVAVSGIALHTVTESRGDRPSLPPAAPDQEERVDRWFAPERTS